MEFINYMMFSNFSHSEGQPEPPSDLEIWTLEFGGSCVTIGSRAGIVLIFLDGDVNHLAYKLLLKNTNNIGEYEALLLGITVTKKRGVKVLRDQGDA